MGRASRVPPFGFEKAVEFCFGVFIVPSSNLFSKQMIRGKPHALASTPATPKKNVSCFFDLAGVNFFLKMERIFFFGVLPSKYSGSAWGFNTDSAKRKSIFLGKRIFRFASTDFPPAGGVWGGMRAGFGLGVFGNSAAMS